MNADIITVGKKMQTNILSTSNTPINRGPNNKRLVLKKKRGGGRGDIIVKKKKYQAKVYR